MSLLKDGITLFFNYYTIKLFSLMQSAHNEYDYNDDSDDDDEVAKSLSNLPSSCRWIWPHSTTFGDRQPSRRCKMIIGLQRNTSKTKSQTYIVSGFMTRALSCSDPPAAWLIRYCKIDRTLRDAASQQRRYRQLDEEDCRMQELKHFQSRTTDLGGVSGPAWSVGGT